VLFLVCIGELRAYNKLEHGTIDAASEFLMNSNINRSPSSYLLNPQSERDEYADQGDTDKTMLMLKFMSNHNKPLGALNWFAVHGTSMNNTNQVRDGASRGG
jgi:neutral ceramidase